MRLASPSPIPVVANRKDSGRRRGFVNDEKVVGFRVLNVVRLAYGRAVVTFCGRLLSPCRCTTTASRVLGVLKEAFSRGRNGEAIALSIVSSQTKRLRLTSHYSGTRGYMLRLHLH